MVDLHHERALCAQPVEDLRRRQVAGAAVAPVERAAVGLRRIDRQRVADEVAVVERRRLDADAGVDELAGVERVDDRAVVEEQVVLARREVLDAVGEVGDEPISGGTGESGDLCECWWKSAAT